MIKNQERKQTIKTVVEVTHTLVLAEENFKIMINTLTKLEKKMKTQMVNWRYSQKNNLIWKSLQKIWQHIAAGSVNHTLYKTLGNTSIERVYGVKYMVTEDLTLGGGHVVQYTNDVSQNCTLETHVILLATVTPVNLIKNSDKIKKISILSNRREKCKICRKVFKKCRAELIGWN